MNKLGTKAETLKNLEKANLSNAKVLPQISFTVKGWNKSPDNYWDIKQQLWKDNSIIVRSSALNEDTSESSQAGRYESVAGVTNRDEFFDAVSKVIASFGDDNNENQILVQPMLEDVKICGVAFTLDPNTLGNYYVINYDETGSTSSVTSGSGDESRLLYVFKKEGKMSCQPFIQQICRTLQELEIFFEQDNLDVEFAITKQDILYIFQVRTLCISHKAAEYQKQFLELKRIEEKIKRDQSKKPFLCGEKTIYGVMPDWNPAEMIGIRPKPLAMSLYKEIITDSVWAYQRDNYGYRNLRSFPLMVSFCGLPYIDVRVSFNSFVPAELSEDISEKLVNYYIKRLEEDPSKHDKVEFEIVFSCYTLDLPKRIQVLKEYGFQEAEIDVIIHSLRNVTNNIINHKTGLWRKDYEKISILEQRYEEILASDMGEIEKIYWLLEDCKRYGTLPFAGLARAAFIAVQMLKSMITEGVISQEDYQCFMNDLSTVSSNMNKDFHHLSKNSFLEKYGHLRPGTYDIKSKRYDEVPDLYFDWENKPDICAEIEKKDSFRLTLKQMHKLADVLKENGLNVDIIELMDFIKIVIEGREYGKFVFTKNLSKALEMIGNIGEKYGFSKEDCSFLNIRTVMELYSSTKGVQSSLKNSIQIGREDYDMAKSITLPPLITSPSDVWIFYYPDTEPNYITMKKVTGKTVFIDEVLDMQSLVGKILLIPSADPGYDWIFSKGICGFITQYGGANSHMAIRAGELGIPAVIGIGTKQFNKMKQTHLLEIDGMEKTIRILK